MEGASSPHRTNYKTIECSRTFPNEASFSKQGLSKPGLAQVEILGEEVKMVSVYSHPG